MRSEISKLHQRLGTTMIYVTHDQVEAMTLGTRIVVMNKGDIMQCDSPMNLYNKPDNLFVASFIGSPRMNFIPAVVKVNGNVLITSSIIINTYLYFNFNTIYLSLTEHKILKH